MTSTTTVRRRHVFFLAGFDPKGPGHYHSLYAAQAALQARVSGFSPEVGARRNLRGSHAAQWTVSADDRGQRVDTTFEMLRWDDIVRQHWQRGPLRVLLQSAATTIRLARCGALQRMYRLSKAPVLTANFPLMLAAAALALAFAIGALLIWGALRLQAAPWLALLAGVALMLAICHATVLLIHRIDMGWFLRLARVVMALSRGQVPTLDARIDEFARRIAAVAADTGVDEILVVGHSVGGTLAVSALARAMAEDASLLARRARLSLLTLGHCIPMSSSLRPVGAVAHELQVVAAADIDWVDITSPLDWAAFPSVDPLDGLRPAPDPTGWHPKMLSPRFHLLFTPATFAQLKAKRFLVHLQYLMAAELPGAYDYFAITAGAQTLRARFAGTQADHVHTA